MSLTEVCKSCGKRCLISPTSKTRNGDGDLVPRLSAVERELQLCFVEYCNGHRPKHVYNQWQSGLIRLTLLWMQVEDDLGRDQNLRRFAEIVMRTIADLHEWVVLGRLPRTFEDHPLMLCHQWARLMTWWWHDHGGPAIYLQLNPTGDIVPVPVWPDGVETHTVEDVVFRARREYRRLYHNRQTILDKMLGPSAVKRKTKVVDPEDPSPFG